MYGGFHPKSVVDQLYINRSHGRRSLKSVYNMVRNEEGQMVKYMLNSPQRGNGNSK